MRAAVVIEADVEAAEVPLVREAHVADDLFLGSPFLTGAHRDGGAVRVVGADVGDLAPAHALEAHPDVGLDVLEHVAEVNRAVRVGQRRSDEESPAHDGQGGAGAKAIRTPGSRQPGTARTFGGSLAKPRRSWSPRANHGTSGREIRGDHRRGQRHRSGDGAAFRPRGREGRRRTISGERATAAARTRARRQPSPTRSGRRAARPCRTTKTSRRRTGHEPSSPRRSASSGASTCSSTTPGSSATRRCSRWSLRNGRRFSTCTSRGRFCARRRRPSR